ncbi:hypothetical protein [Pseudophaeobacter flagellatus]|uniref:hypothetical protein n=1 Tax=Pseudophaeobacter flagellatus TaxID=2899119 RepID=UPI001E49510E|nr:hypothetical protein [Pseudophaeobacter flagellatus]MCD9147866.1 hypothetical protein [Pseudophaeobacter flagellatus]
MAAPPLSLTLSPSSAADTGDNLIDAGDFTVDFGDKITGDGGAAANSNPIANLGGQVIQGVLVAVLAKWAFEKVFK